MKTYLKHIQKIVAIFPFTLLLSSCGRDFPSVQKFGQMTTTLEQASSNMADDIYNSCITRTKYIPFWQVQDSSGSSQLHLREQQEKSCDEYNKPASIAVKDANALLIDYIKALGKLASGDTVSFDKNFTALGESLKNLKVPRAEGKPFSFNNSNIDAGISIAKFITNAITREFRREKLKQAILCTDKDIQTYIGEVSTSSAKDSVSELPATGGLIALTQNGYVDGILQEEEKRIRNYFLVYTKVIEGGLNDRDIDFIELERSYNNAMDSLRSRRDAAQNYVEILRLIAQMHTKLKAEFQDEGKDRMSEEQLKGYCQDVFTSKADKAANKEKVVTYDPEKLRKVENIISEYTKTLEPLIKKLDKGF